MGNVNLERKEAHVFDIDGLVQLQDAITVLTPFTDGFRIRIACVPVKDLFVFILGIWPGVCFPPENVLIFLTWGCGFNLVFFRSQIHHFGIAWIRFSGLFFSIMGCLVLDGEVEDFLFSKHSLNF